MLSWIKNNQNWWKKNSWYFAVSLLPCHSARNRRRRLRIHVRVINHSAPGEGGRRRRWVSVGKIIFHHLLSTLKGSFSTERSLSFAYWNNGFCNSGQALRAEWQEGGVWVEDESSSIKCAATNFKNELTLFFLKDINQLKPTYIASIQNWCTQHQLNKSTRHQISFRLIFLVRKLSLFAVCLPPCHSARSRRRSRRIHDQKLNLSYKLLFRWICFFDIGANRP